VDQIHSLTELRKKRVNRRNFLAGAGALGAAAAIAGCSNDGNVAATTTTTPTTKVTDAQILTFALNLEYLEAEFYLRCATGSGLSSTDAGTGAGSVNGGSMVVVVTTQQQQYINEIAYEEQTHVEFLRSALSAAGATVPPRPALDFTAGFGAIAAAANASSPGAIPSSFSPFANFDSFLIGAFSFEDVGVTAYAGAAALLNGGVQGSPYLAAAAGILAIEGYHAAEIRTLLTGRAIAAGSQAAYPYLGYANAVSAVRGALGGGNEQPLVFPTTSVFNSATPSNASTIVAANSTTAVGFARTTDQVLHIVYGAAGGAGVAKGGFFPSGLNGSISVTAS
jgi:hypothetical protein